MTVEQIKEKVANSVIYCISCGGILFSEEIEEDEKHIYHNCYNYEKYILWYKS